MSSIRIASVLALAALAASPASAVLTYELRAPGLVGRELTLPAAGGTFTLQLYANITDTPRGEGLGSASVNLFSRPIGGGVATGGGVTAFQLDSRGTLFQGQIRGAHNGGNPLAGDPVPSYTNDGVLDWGTAAIFDGNTPTPIQVQFQKSVTYISTDDSQTPRTNYTIGNEILIGTFTIAFSPAQVKSSAAPDARTRFQLDLPRRIAEDARGVTQWLEDAVLPASSEPGVSNGRRRSGTVPRNSGPDQTAQNIGFADSPLAYVDFKLGTSTPPPPTSFIDLVSDGSTGDLPFLGRAALNVAPEAPVALETPVNGATKGYLDIVTNGQLGAPAAPIFVAMDLIGDALPPNFTVVEGSAASSSVLAAAREIWGEEYDAVFRFDAPQPDIAYDFNTVGVNSLVVFNESFIPVIPPPIPTFLDLVANGALSGLPRLGAAALNVPPEDAISLETPLNGATEGYLDIVTNGQLGAPTGPIFIALDIIGDLLPEAFTAIDGSIVSAELLTTAQSIWGEEYDVVLRFDVSQSDIVFDFNTTGITSIVVFTQSSIPEPTSLALLALPAAALYRRRR